MPPSSPPNYKLWRYGAIPLLRTGDEFRRELPVFQLDEFRLVGGTARGSARISGGPACVCEYEFRPHKRLGVFGFAEITIEYSVKYNAGGNHSVSNCWRTPESPRRSVGVGKTQTPFTAARHFGRNSSEALLLFFEQNPSFYPRFPPVLTGSSRLRRERGCAARCGLSFLSAGNCPPVALWALRGCEWLIYGVAFRAAIGLHWFPHFRKAMPPLSGSSGISSYFIMHAEPPL